MLQCAAARKTRSKQKDNRVPDALYTIDQLLVQLGLSVDQAGPPVQPAHGVEQEQLQPCVNVSQVPVQLPLGADQEPV